MAVILIGRYNSAVVHTKTIEESAKKQIIDLLNSPASEGSQSIVIMPDVHPGKGSVIGLTMTITDRIVPNLCGVDLSCGVRTVKLADKKIDLAQLDEAIRTHVPSGKNIRTVMHRVASCIERSLPVQLRCVSYTDIERALYGIGTLGGGNHFIEVDSDEEGSLYLLIHSGSRHIGKQVAEYYQKRAIQECPCKDNPDLAYLTGQSMTDYLFDASLMTMYATLNRRAIQETIVEEMNLQVVDAFDTLHNYIASKKFSDGSQAYTEYLIRKGSVSAESMERFIVPLNMRDGSLICKGKGNREWNWSAPHGAGRCLSRKEARILFSLDYFQKEMEDAGVCSTTINESTLDEAPEAYKDSSEIESQLAETADVLNHLTPIYNYKAGE